jgi:hypothetical protein
MIREEIEELFSPVITPDWSDQEIIDYIQSILPLVPDEDLDENLELIERLKAEIRNKKIEIILKKD